MLLGEMSTGGAAAVAVQISGVSSRARSGLQTLLDESPRKSGQKASRCRAEERILSREEPACSQQRTDEYLIGNPSLFPYARTSG